MDSPEGVVTSPIGGIYEQTNAAATSHPGWWKNSGVGDTGWRAWAGLRGTDGASTSIRIGDGSVASAARAIAIGDDSVVAVVNGVGIGSVTLLSPDDISIGHGHSFGAAVAHGSVVIGKGNTILTGTDASSSTPALYGAHVMIGEGCEIPYAATQFQSITIGYLAKARGRSVIAIGQEAESRAADTPVAGKSAGLFATLIGYRAKGSGGCIVAVGDQSDVRGDNTAAVGTHTRANDSDTAAFGPNAFAGSVSSTGTGTYAGAYGVAAIALGNAAGAYGSSSNATANHSLALGPSARVDNALFGEAVAMGYGAKVTGPQTLMIGGGITDGYPPITAIHFNGSSTPGLIIDPNGNVLINDSAGTSVTRSFPIAANITLAATEGVAIMNAQATMRTVTFPAATPTGKFIYVRKTDSSANVVRVLPTGADTIDGGTQYDLTGQQEWAIFRATPGDWSLYDTGN